MTALFIALIAQVWLLVGCVVVAWRSRGRANLWRVLLALSFGCGSLAGGMQHNPRVIILTVTLNTLQCGYWTYAAIAHRRDGHAAPSTRKDAP